jgi:vacuolar-type H+-ATPase subunit C/Vma6
MKFPLQVAPLLAFFMWKEMEIRDIITVLSGKDLGLPQERIREYIITL